MISDNLLDYSVSRLTSLFKEWGEPRYRATQVIQWLHQSRVTQFSLMTNLSKKLRDKLAAHFFIHFPEVTYEKISNDGTIKWLLRLHDGNSIESVYIPEKTRATLCVSSQVGCALNCSFCATGKEGFNRNLSMGEVISQLWLAQEQLAKHGIQKRISNVVMMGMGEPLLNYDNVLGAMDLMLSDHAYGLSKYRVTLSTSGVVPNMIKLKEASPVALAVSLHAANNALRNELVPINKKYPLEVLIPLCKNYFSGQAKREVTYEYVMLDGVNDQPEHAQQLITLLKGAPGKINLIPFNPFSQSHYKTSPPEVVARFQKQLINGGLMTWVRKTRGDDVDAACGQLAGDITDRTGRHQRWIKTGKLIPSKKAHGGLVD